MLESFARRLGFAHLGIVLDDGRHRIAESLQQWNATRAGRVATTALRAIEQAMLACVHRLARAKVPVQLLRLQVLRADGRAVAASNAGHFEFTHGEGRPVGRLSGR